MRVNHPFATGSLTTFNPTLQWLSQSDASTVALGNDDWSLSHPSAAIKAR
jgi:hypothetical protein